tara:strand:+ start:647 stop:757 length:111 start_codon:yes stop_codon:yes gene_type:complete
MLTYNNTIYFGNTKEDVIDKVEREIDKENLYSVRRG